MRSAARCFVLRTSVGAERAVLLWRALVKLLALGDAYDAVSRIAQLAREFGHDVVELTDPDEAIARADTSVDLVIIDGVTTARAAASFISRATADTPRIALLVGRDFDS